MGQKKSKPVEAPFVSRVFDIDLRILWERYRGFPDYLWCVFEFLHNDPQPWKVTDKLLSTDNLNPITLRNRDLNDSAMKNRDSFSINDEDDEGGGSTQSGGGDGYLRFIRHIEQVRPVTLQDLKDWKVTSEVLIRFLVEFVHRLPDSVIPECCGMRLMESTNTIPKHIMLEHRGQLYHHPLSSDADSPPSPLPSSLSSSSSLSFNRDVYGETDNISKDERLSFNISVIDNMHGSHYTLLRLICQLCLKLNEKCSDSLDLREIALELGPSMFRSTLIRNAHRTANNRGIDNNENHKKQLALTLEHLTSKSFMFILENYMNIFEYNLYKENHLIRNQLSQNFEKINNQNQYILKQHLKQMNDYTNLLKKLNEKRQLYRALFHWKFQMEPLKSNHQLYLENERLRLEMKEQSLIISKQQRTLQTLYDALEVEIFEHTLIKDAHKSSLINRMIANKKYQVSSIDIDHMSDMKRNNSKNAMNVSDVNVNVNIDGCEPRMDSVLESIWKKIGDTDEKDILDRSLAQIHSMRLNDKTVDLRSASPLRSSSEWAIRK